MSSPKVLQEFSTAVMYEPQNHLYEFGPFRLDLSERQLFRDGAPVSLTPKAFETLVALVRKSGHVVEKDDLLKEVWADTFVEEANISRHVWTLRKTLGENMEGHKYIETVSKRGYRFIASVREVAVDFQAHILTRSLAVLPFRVIGAEAEGEYLGLGITDALITRLSQIRQITVRPTSSVLRYAASEQDPLAIGRELGVDTVLSGHVRRCGEQIRVTMQLLNILDGSLLWAENLDQHFTNIFAYEDSISEQVARALRLKLSDEQAERLSRRYTENTTAYQLYLKGRYYWNKRASGGLKRAIEYFEQAIEIDPDYALAYAGLADSYILLNTMPPRDVMPRAKTAAIKALEIDDGLAEAHASLAKVKDNYDWDWPGAEREYLRAIKLNPNYATTRQWYAEHLAAMGRHVEGIAEIRRAQALDPLSLSISNSVARQFCFAREYDQATEQCRNILEMDPNFLPTHYRLALIYAHQKMYQEAIAEFLKTVELSGAEPVMMAALGYGYAVAGKYDEAQKVIDDLRKLSEQRYIEPSYLAQIYMGLGKKDQSFEWLEKAYAERFSLMVYLKVDPVFDSLRSDPRFTDLLRRVGLAQ